MTFLGILLPSSVLETDWFLHLATFVAFNTIVFAALSVWHMLPSRRRG
ncbi:MULTISPECIES: hypothetical protein [unclassified Nocardioides]|nr:MULTISPECIES: hypothetical protein [unclassified Nocardioides]